METEKGPIKSKIMSVNNGKLYMKNEQRRNENNEDFDQEGYSIAARIRRNKSKTKSLGLESSFTQLDKQKPSEECCQEKVNCSKMK